MRRFVALLVVLAVVPLPHLARAFDFVPTEAEWMAWPDWCKAKFVGDNPDAYPEFYRRVTPDMRERARSFLGSCWGPAHHYCGGIAKFGRAMRIPDKLSRNFALNDAMNEHFFVRRNNCPTDNPFWSDNETRIAIIQDALGRTSDAMQSLDNAEKANPNFPGQYLVRARILTRAGKTSEARMALQNGDELTNGSSAEIAYALGLSFFNSKEFEQAREHARKAYALGYPLPWLREQLKKSGYPL